jgi:hypothetical protein
MEDGSMTDFIFETSSNSNSHNLGERGGRKRGRTQRFFSNIRLFFRLFVLKPLQTEKTSDISSDTSSDIMLFKPK